MSFEEWWEEAGRTESWEETRRYWERRCMGFGYELAKKLAKAAWEAGYQRALVEIWKRQAEERDGEKAESARG